VSVGNWAVSGKFLCVLSNCKALKASTDAVGWVAGRACGL